MNNSQKIRDKVLEYPDAPSGHIALYKYKEPFMPFESGYGYEGVLMLDGDKDVIQCHFCGEWFATLQHHLKKEHNMGVSEYKDKVGLAQTTALISEGFRATLIANGDALAKRMKNLRSPHKRSQKTKDKISAGLKKHTRETQNITGTCPAQLIARLRAKHDELGRTPKEKEITFYETLRKVWGMKKACQIAGIEYRPNTERIEPHKYKYSQEDVVLWIREYVQKNGRLPKVIEWIGRAGEHHAKRLGGWRKLCNIAVSNEEQYQRLIKQNYTKQDLISYLVEFKKQNGRNPSHSDCRRGVIPKYARYYYQFGSWKGALKAAGI